MKPFVRRALFTDDAFDAVRVAPDGSRAYLAGSTPRVIDLRVPTWTLGPKHDVSGWVRRTDGDGVSLWRDCDHVRIAEVVR